MINPDNQKRVARLDRVMNWAKGKIKEGATVSEEKAKQSKSW